MRMVSDEEILEWFNKKFPQYAGNLELAKVYWRSKHGGAVKKDYAKIKVFDVDSHVGDLVEVEGMVAQIREITYQACPKCGASVKRGCEHLDAGEEPITKYLYDIAIGDDTGVAKAIYISDEPVFIELGDKIVIRGKVKSRYSDYLQRDEISVSVYKLDIVEKLDGADEEEHIEKASDVVKDPMVENILGLIRSGKKTKAYVERVLKYRKLEWSKIEPYVEIYEDKGIEYVRVKDE